MAHLDWVRVRAVRPAAHPTRPAPGLGAAVRARTGRWVGERAAVDVLVLARKNGRAFASFDSLIARQGGKRYLYGGPWHWAATVIWAEQAGMKVPDLTAIFLR